MTHGYSQVAKVDLYETFALCGQFFFINIRCILVLGAVMDWEIHQNKCEGGVVFMKYWSWRFTWMNRKVLYKKGMSTLCANWRKYCTGSSNCQGRGTTVSTHFSSTQIFVGAKRIIRYMSNKRVIFLLLTRHYVDNLIILANNLTQLKWFKSKFKKEFKLSDIGELYYYLGVEFKRHREAGTIIMNHEVILKRFSSISTWNNAN